MIFKHRGNPEDLKSIKRRIGEFELEEKHGVMIL